MVTYLDKRILFHSTGGSQIVWKVLHGSQKLPVAIRRANQTKPEFSKVESELGTAQPQLVTFLKLPYQLVRSKPPMVLWSAGRQGQRVATDRIVINYKMLTNLTLITIIS